jgi:hypothetical protein
MCSEFILALIYFTVIFVVNFFLSKLLKTYLNNILYILKIKNIFNLYKPNEVLTISVLYSLTKKNIVNLNSLNSLEKIIQKEESYNKKDIIILSNIYKNLEMYFNEKEKTQNYYFSLLKQQYFLKK